MTQVMDRKSTEKNPTARVRLLDLGNVSAEWGVDRLIERSIELRASDLFLVTNEQHVSVQVRLRGQMEQLCILDADQGPGVLPDLVARPPGKVLAQAPT